MDSFNYIYGLFGYIAALERFDSKDIFDMLPFHLSVKQDIRKKQTYKNAIIYEPSESWFDILPSIIQHKIFKLLDHYSLIQFAHAYSNYKSTLIHPIYWTDLGVRLDDYVLTKDEFKMLSSYLNDYLLEADIDFFYEDESKIFNLMTQIAQNNHNLQKLKINCNKSPRIIGLVYTSFKKLSSLDICYFYLNDYHVVQITDNLSNLKSLKVTSELEINFGLEYFLEKVKYLDGFGFFLPKTSKRVFDLVYDKHKISLKFLSYGMDFLVIDHEILVKLKEFTELSRLELYNYRISRPLHEILDRLHNLETLKLCPKVFDADNREFNKLLFTNYKFKLKKLGLKDVELSKNGIELLCICCPNLEMLSIKGIFIKEDEFEVACKYLSSLKYLYLKQRIHPNENFTFNIIDNIVRNLKQLEFLYIHKSTKEITAVKNEFFLKLKNLYSQTKLKVAAMFDSKEIYISNSVYEQLLE